MSKSYDLSAEQAVLLLRKVVFEKGPDFVYTCPNPDVPRNWCYNVWEGQPSCIVGHVVAELGLKAEDYGRYGISDRAAAYELISFLNHRDEFAWHITYGAECVLKAAQLAQDSGKTWGEALAEAEQVRDALANRPK